jgi:hypothetical protein
VYMEGRPWPVVAFAIMLVTTSVMIPNVGSYTSLRQSIEASNSQVLAWGNHNWSGCGIGAHLAPKCDPREQPVVNELVLEGSLLSCTVTTDEQRSVSTTEAARKAVRICGTSFISINLDSPKLIGPFSILQCG